MDGHLVTAPVFGQIQGGIRTAQHLIETGIVRLHSSHPDADGAAGPVRQHGQAAHRSHHPLGHCHGISKNCLAFGGVNMRLQVYARDAGLLLLSSRFTFFQEVRRTPAVARLTPV